MGGIGLAFPFRQPEMRANLRCTNEDKTQAANSSIHHYALHRRDARSTALQNYPEGPIIFPQASAVNLSDRYQSIYAEADRAAYSLAGTRASFRCGLRRGCASPGSRIDLHLEEQFGAPIRRPVRSLQSHGNLDRHRYGSVLRFKEGALPRGQTPYRARFSPRA